MKVLILGSGVLGVTTAYFLSKRGYDVEVIDREPESARETSFANGGQLSYNHAEPWASPSVIPKVIKWLGREGSPLVYHPSVISPFKWWWSLHFMRNCTPDRTRTNTRHMLRLGLYSRRILHNILEETPVDFNYLKKGILHIFQDEHGFRSAIKQADFQAKLGGPYEKFTPQQCVDKEPALAGIADKLVGGIYYADDESGDVCAFTQALSDKDLIMGKKIGGKSTVFHYDTNIIGLKTDGNKVVGVETDKGVMEADMYVMAMGSYSHIHLKKIGINVPIYPMKGYSISVPVNGHKGAPTVSVTNQAAKIVYSRLGDIVRVVGLAEFTGYDDSITQKYITHLKKQTKAIFPDCGDIEQATEWACLRPQTPDGPPILGKCRYENLMLCTGNGTLGWTQGPGSAKIVADLIDGRPPEINLTGLTAERFE